MQPRSLAGRARGLPRACVRELAALPEPQAKAHTQGRLGPASLPRSAAVRALPAAAADGGAWGVWRGSESGGRGPCLHWRTAGLRPKRARAGPGLREAKDSERRAGTEAAGGPAGCTRSIAEDAGPGTVRRLRDHDGGPGAPPAEGRRLPVPVAGREGAAVVWPECGTGRGKRRRHGPHPGLGYPVAARRVTRSSA